MIEEEPEGPPPRQPKKVVDAGFLVLAGFTMLGGLAVALQQGMGRVGAIVAETFGFIGLLSPKIAAGIFIAAALPLILPREKVAAWIGTDNGTRGLFIAALAGAAIPGGPMMTFTLAAGFATVGADAGALVAFVTGWSLLSLNRTLIWEFSFLPPELVLVRVLLCLPFPVLLGLAARALLRSRPA